MIRDTLHLLVAQVVVLAGNYAIHAGLGRLLGPAEYGLFGVAMSLVSLLEFILVRGMRDTVSRFAAGQPERAPAIRRQALRLQALLSAGLWAVFWLAAPGYARLMSAPALVGPLRIASLMVPLASLFSVYLGDLSGRGLFRRRALAMNLQSLGKVAAVFLLAGLGFGISGALTGYVLSYLLAMAGVMRLAHDPRPVGDPFPAGQIVRTAAPIFLFSILMAISNQVDLMLVKGMMADGRAAGYYTAAKMLSRPAQQVFAVFSFTLLPAVAGSLASGGAGLPALLRRSTRFLWLLLAPLTAVAWAAADPLVRVLYSSRFAPAVAPFRLLLLATALATLYSILATALIAAGRMAAPLATAAFLAALQAVLAPLAIARLGMTGAALSGIAIYALGCAWLGVTVHRRLAPFADWPAIARIAAAAAASGVFVWLWPFSGPWRLAGVIPALALYAVLLLGLKEIDAGEREAVWRFLNGLRPGRRRRGAG